MKNNLRFCLALAFVILFGVTASQARSETGNCSLKINHRFCESLKEPVGLDEAKPRFSWTFEPTDPNAKGQRQTAYEMVVRDLADQQLWNTGWVESDQMQWITYNGKPLQSDTTYYWTLRVKDEAGRISAPVTSSWTTGLLDPNLWTAAWIGSQDLFDQKIGISKGDCNLWDPWLRNTFELKATPEKANLYVASVGYHEVYVNGKKVHEDVLAPTATDHTKRARYLVYPIEKFLQPGKNVIALWLGTSWSIFPGYMTENLPRTPIVSAQVDIYAKKNDPEPVQRIRTNENWKIKNSPNKLLGTWDFRNMGGDLWDDNLAQHDWNSVSLDDSQWKNAQVYRPNLTLSAQRVERNYPVTEIKPVSMEEKGDGVYRIDMGVNFAGWLELELSAEPGKKVDIRLSERQQDEMTFNNYSAFIMGPTGKGVFKNRFNYGSGRWVTLRGLNQKPDLNKIRGWMIRTNFDRVTRFECSDPLQNWIYDRVCWTLENLALGGMIVDCPQRERMGYGGDAHATSETAMFNYRLGAFYTKWLEDWRDVQGTEPMVGDMNNPDWARKAVTSGRIFGTGIQPHTAPTYWGGGGPSWGGICVTLPWFLYLHDGDPRILVQNLEMIRRWLEFLDENVQDDLLQRFGGQWDFLGDWLWPNATAEGMNNDSSQTACLNNCYRVFNLRTAAKIARTIADSADADENLKKQATQLAQKWEQQAEASSQAIQEKFYRPEDHSYADGSMACLAAALFGEVMPADLRQQVINRLEKEILVVRKGHIHVGITGGAMLFKVLRNENRDDLIFSMTSQTDYPSWGYMKESDATTIWEMWEKDLPGHSLLHSSYLYPGAWYVDGMTGIKRDPTAVGFKRFIVQPPVRLPNNLTWAKAEFDSPAGKIETSWRRTKENKALEVNVTVPPNTTARVILPENTVPADPKTELKPGQNQSETPKGSICYEIPAGTYRFVTSD